jgi:hypothetical protein
MKRVATSRIPTHPGKTYALVNRAMATRQCRLDNGNALQEPVLSEPEKADTQAFLKDILQILHLVGLRVFEFPKAVTSPKTSTRRALAKTLIG